MMTRVGKKPGRNEPCPCGSEKKFKRCHGAVPRLSAQEQSRVLLLNRSVGDPRLKILAESVLEFFGEQFRYEESDAFPNSRFEVKFSQAATVLPEIPPLAPLQHALVKIKTGTDRVSSALAHELLHLELRIGGQPVGDALAVPAALQPFFPQIAPAYSVLTNLVDHEIMFSRFLELGFDPSTFLGPLDNSIDYERTTSGYRSPERPDCIGRAWWSFEYFRHWITSRHRAGSAELQAAGAALDAATRTYPEMPRIAEAIREWVRKGAFKEPSSHPTAINEFLQILDLPSFARWSKLERTQQGLRSSVVASGP